MANNGVLTLTTALDRIYARAYFYMPAGAISAGSTAGWYYTVCTTSTACTVNNNVYTAGLPAIPTPVAFATTGPGAYTQTTGAEIVAQVLTVPANSMGANGSLDVVTKWSFENTAGAKTPKIKFGGSSVWGLALTNKATTIFPVSINNRTFTNQQVTTNSIDAGYGSDTTVFTQTAIDTTADATLGPSCQLAVDTDWCAIIDLRVNVWPAP